jgi:hypothetical protein
MPPKRYREAMLAILRRHGGAFDYDLLVSQVLKSEVETAIDRIFSMIFPDANAHQRFFADPASREVRRTWFDASVGSVTRLGVCLPTPDRS